MGNYTLRKIRRGRPRVKENSRVNWRLKVKCTGKSGFSVHGTGRRFEDLRK